MKSYKTIEHDKEASEKWCIVDCDGVCNTYPDDWLLYLQKATGKTFHDLQEAKNTVSYYDYKRLKFQYRTDGTKRQLTIRKNIQALLLGLQALDYKIAIVTARDIRLSYEDTIHWLNKNNIHYDRVLFDTKKHSTVFEVFPNAKLVIEDNSHIAEMFAKCNMKVFLIRTTENEKYEPPKNVIIIKDLLEVLDHDI